jgi:hypothetical protein
MSTASEEAFDRMNTMGLELFTEHGGGCYVAGATDYTLGPFHDWAEALRNPMINPKGSTMKTTCNICDGSGITFTQSMEQGGYADADSVAACPVCGPSRYAGYDAVYVARVLAARLLAGVPASDLDPNGRAWTQIVVCYSEPDRVHTVGIRSDIAEASMFGYENTPEGGHFATYTVKHERGPVVVDTESAIESGLFVALVAIARLYVAEIDGDLSCALQGLAENLEDEFGGV